MARNAARSKCRNRDATIAIGAGSVSWCFRAPRALNVCAPTASRETCQPGETLAKGQMRSNKEKKKPKAEWNKKKRAPNPSPFALGQAQNKPANAKKG